MKRSVSCLSASVFIASCLAGIDAEATIFGLESCGSGNPGLCASEVSGGGSLPPAHLFSMDADGTNFTDFGIVMLADKPIDADGLALRSDGQLFAFGLTEQVTGPDASGNVSSNVLSSRLISLGTGTPGATAIGSGFARDIRGAAFDADNRLWVIDANNDAVLQVDTMTGAEVAGTVMTLLLGGASFDLSTASDIALRADGKAFLANLGNIYSLDLATGALTAEFSNAADAYAGLALDPASPSTLLTYEINGRDDIYSYDTSLGTPTRTDVLLDFIPTLNAGRGDLASLVRPVPEPAAFALLIAGALGLGFGPRRRRG